MNLRDLAPNVPNDSIATGIKLYRVEFSRLYLAIFLISACAATEPGALTATALLVERVCLGM